MDQVTTSFTRRMRRLHSSLQLINALHENSQGTNSSAERIQVVQNSYVGLWIRIKHRFGPRVSEWIMSAHMLAAALVLFTVDDLFSRSIYKTFDRIFHDQYYLAIVLFVCAIARLTGLIINGSRPIATPAIRQWSAAVGFLVWIGISYCFAESGVLGLWLACWPLFAVTELINFYRAAHDHGEAYVGRGHK